MTAYRRPPIGALVCAVLTTMSVAACRSTDWSRHVEARAGETMFSPIDLPTPTSARTGSGAPGPGYWQQRADYAIDATLDDSTNRITGRATVTYTNNSPDSLDYVWLHLEQNIFRDDSIGAAVSTSAHIAMRRAQGDGVTVETLSAGGADLPYEVYDTLARVDLPEPIAAGGGQLVFDIAWSFTIPDKVFRRFGILEVDQGTIYEVAQWFPALVVYDDVHGWNTLPYVGTGEFYTDFGDYDVSLTVPRSHLVAATGALLNPEEVFTPDQVSLIETARQSNDTVIIRGPDDVDDPLSRPPGDGPLTWRFRAENVRTIAWASSDAYIYDACNLDGILVQSMYPKEKLDLWDDSTQMLRTAIEGYNERWYRYPYPAATNVYGKEGGMEYPMIIFCRGSSERGLYGVTTHEIGHNWFPMIVSTDERRHAWMDEGFNTFINYYSFGRWFPGEYGRRGAAAPFARRMLRDRPPIDTAPDQLPRGTLGELEYQKTAVGLVLLREQILGPDRFDHAFRTYIERWAFKSPRPADFYRTMEDAAGCDLAWFWRGWFRENASLDQMVRTVRQPRVKDATDAKDRQTRNVSVTLDNLGPMVMPVVLEITYDDGSVEIRRLPVEVWHSSDRCRTTWPSERRVVKVIVDPYWKFPDVDRSNNTWRQ